MARKWYGRPSAHTLEDLTEGRRVDMERIEAHGPRWIADPTLVGLGDQETAAILYGLGFSIPRGQMIESVDIIPPNWDVNTTDEWEVHLTLSDGRTIMRSADDTELIKNPYYGLAPRLRLEGIELGDAIGSL